jgi:hypothetical protein
LGVLDCFQELLTQPAECLAGKGRLRSGGVLAQTVHDSGEHSKRRNAAPKKQDNCSQPGRLQHSQKQPRKRRAPEQAAHATANLFMTSQSSFHYHLHPGVKVLGHHTASIKPPLQPSISPRHHPATAAVAVQVPQPVHNLFAAGSFVQCPDKQSASFMSVGGLDLAAGAAAAAAAGTGATRGSCNWLRGQHDQASRIATAAAASLAGPPAVAQLISVQVVNPATTAAAASHGFCTGMLPDLAGTTPSTNMLDTTPAVASMVPTGLLPTVPAAACADQATMPAAAAAATATAAARPPVLSSPAAPGPVSTAARDEAAVTPAGLDISEAVQKMLVERQQHHGSGS